jgi:hypothetical protein
MERQPGMQAILAAIYENYIQHGKGMAYNSIR